MISFNNIGYLGRLGNQMFQYSALRGIASHKNYSYSVSRDNPLYDCFKLPRTKQNKNSEIFSTEKFEFDENFFNTCPDNIDIFGYFQTEKYFKHIENEIRQDFTFHDRVSNICKIYIDQIYSGEIISLHIRRSDYLTNSNFVVLGMDYYENALQQLPDVPVIIFSDDIQWCKNYFTDKKFTISMSNNSYIDLCLMSHCNYHIIANSSFSWWGSWLAKSQKTFAPRKWFCGEFSHWNTQDLYLPDWITI